MKSMTNSNAEPKPTPSTPTALFRLEGDYIYCNKCNRGNPIIYGSQHYTDCELCIIPAKPQPDSSSISTERVEKSLAEQINSLWTGKEKLPCGCPANSEYIYYNSETGHAHCVKCGDAYTHDSQSEPISTEQTFEEWAAIYDKSLLAPRGGRKARNSARCIRPSMTT